MLLPLSVPETSVVPDPEIAIVPDSLFPVCCQVNMNVPLTGDGAAPWYWPDQVPESAPEVGAPVVLVDWLGLVGGEVEARVLVVGTVLEVFVELLQPVIATKRTTKHPIVVRQPLVLRPAGVTKAGLVPSLRPTAER